MEASTDKLKSWVPLQEVYESEALSKQVAAVCSLSVLHEHLALMPDAHGGYGMPIGGVAALRNAVSPYMVGLDIGCGMLATKTKLMVEDIPVELLLQAIGSIVPVGVGGQYSKSASNREFADQAELGDFLSKENRDAVYLQIGTLGSGNHFIEFDEDPDDHSLWIVIHSGSRRYGKLTAEYFHKLAVEQCRSRKIAYPNSDLAYLSEGTDEFAAYVVALDSALEYARLNRECMESRILQVVAGNTKTELSINVHHNFATQEEHFGERVWVHRKGATRAKEGKPLVIPMNMGDGVIIGAGLGNKDSFESCSHGAGRTMGRGQAKRNLDRAEEQRYLDERGIILCSKSDVLDEMPHAYKDSQTVMGRQSDLVRIDKWLKPLGVIKG